MDNYFNPNTAVGVARLRWVEALQSGKYSQGTGGLGDPKNGYCCLGVGCDILEIPFRAPSPSSVEFVVEMGLNDLAGSFVDHERGGFCEVMGTRSLVKANDSALLPHAVIAQIILQHPEFVFKPA